MYRSNFFSEAHGELFVEISGVPGTSVKRTWNSLKSQALHLEQTFLLLHSLDGRSLLM